MEIKDIKAVYFVGAGGIGMSAIARYFLSKKLVVAGYDKTPSNLTHELEKEGMLIHYEENVDLIPEACKDARNTLVVYTPAIPAEHKELVYFRENGFTIEKRRCSSCRFLLTSSSRRLPTLILVLGLRRR